MITPLSFVAAYSERHGALVEAGARTTEILQPPGVIERLDVPEHGRYAERPEAAQVWVGYGSPALERFLHDATLDVPWTVMRLQLPGPVRESSPRSAVERFALRNAVHEIEQVVATRAGRLVAHVRFALLADDRREGLSTVTMAVGSRTAVPEFWSAAQTRGTLTPATSASPAAADLAKAASAALARTEVQARRESQPFLDGFARRLDRDRRRIGDYFLGLRHELDKRARRRRLDPDAVAHKRAAIDRERAAKLRELDERGRVRIETSLVAAVHVLAPVAEVTLNVRRRKGRRSLALEYDAATSCLVAPACEACAREARAPAICDGALHLVCERCVPDATGRWRCPACR